MTTDQIVDRELDAWLAEHLFGLVQCTSTGHDDSYPAKNCHADPRWPDQGGEDARWSSSGDGMLQVLEAMAGKGYTCVMMHVDNQAQHVAAFYEIGARPTPPLEVMETLQGREKRLGAAGNMPLPRVVAHAARLTLEAAQ